MAGVKEPVGIDGGALPAARAGCVREGDGSRLAFGGVFARLTRMRKTHVLSDERSSKESIPRSTPIHVSWTTSSATAAEPTNERASRYERRVEAVDEVDEHALVGGAQRGYEVLWRRRRGATCLASPRQASPVSIGSTLTRDPEVVKTAGGHIDWSHA